MRAFVFGLLLLPLLAHGEKFTLLMPDMREDQTLISWRDLSGLKVYKDGVFATVLPVKSRLITVVVNDCKYHEWEFSVVDKTAPSAGGPFESRRTPSAESYPKNIACPKTAISSYYYGG